MNIFGSLQKCVLFLFQQYSSCICMPILVSEFWFSKNLEFYKLSYVIFNFNIHMLDENLLFYQKMSQFLFKLHSNCVWKPIIVSLKITTKIFKFYSFLTYFHNFIRYMLCKILQIYQ